MPNKIYISSVHFELDLLKITDVYGVTFTLQCDKIFVDVVVKFCYVIGVTLFWILKNSDSEMLMHFGCSK